MSVPAQKSEIVIPFLDILVGSEGTLNLGNCDCQDLERQIFYFGHVKNISHLSNRTCFKKS